MAITKNVYDIPLADSPNLTTMEDIKGYIDTLASFIAEKMGLVVRDDLAVMTPDYAANSYLTFLAPSANEDPYFCIFNSNSHAAYRGFYFEISPAYKDGNGWRCSSSTYVGNDYPNTCDVIRTQTPAIVFRFGNLSTNSISLVVYDFNDGRKFAAFKSYVKSSGAIGFGNNGGLYIGPVSKNGNTINTGLVMAWSFDGPYLEDYDENVIPSFTSNQFSGISNMIMLSSHGFIPDDSTKECLIKANLYIGTGVYIPAYWFSNIRNAEVGRTVNINNKKYVIIWTLNSTGNFVICIPEEVN